MARSIIKHGSRCINNISGDFRRLFKREIALNELRRECGRHLAVAWNEITRPPATEQRKCAVRHLNKGMLFYNEKHYTSAVVEFEEAIAADPMYGRAYLYFGNAKYKLHDTEEALASWAHAVRVDPDSEAGLKAQAKLDQLRSKNQKVIRDIEEQIILS